MRQMIPLPVDAFVPGVLAALKTASGLVLTAAPGAGKTTRVPPALAEAGPGKILLLQPRRVAARLVAERIADERDWKMGQEIGYQVRFENTVGPKSKLIVMTEGILARRLSSDPELGDVSAVVLDEFHERSLHTDVALALLREIQQTLRPDLKIVVMSATLDAAPVAHYLGEEGAPAPVVDVPGRLFPIARSFLPKRDPRDREPYLGEQVARAIEGLVLSDRDDGGDILAFLPGSGEIRRAIEASQSKSRLRDFALLPLYGSLTRGEQDAALGKNSRRKIIFSTNIAETSITIDGVSAVVDAGLVRQSVWDPRLGTERLELVRISRASATQRAGRAGRQRPGRAVALWTEDEDRTLKDADVPEIRRSDLGATLLLLVEWGVTKPESFGWFEAPAPARLEASLKLLRSLGALEHKDGAWRATPFGRELLRYPADPRTAALLARTQDPEAARLAAELQEGSTRPTPQSERVARELARLQERAGSFARHTLHEALLLAFADKIARRREAGSNKAVQVGGRGLVIEDASLPAKAEHFVVLAAHEGTGGNDTRVVKAEPVDLAELRRLRPEAFRDAVEHHLNEETHKVSATRTLYYEDLPVDGPHSVPVDPVEVAKLQRGQGAASRAELLRRSSEAYVQWELRLRFLQLHAPELGLAPPNDEALESFFESFPDPAAWPGAWRGFFEGFWSFDQRRTFEAEAPTHLNVPTEREMPLIYADDASEVKCAVRLQELFGWLESPTVAKGKKRITLELLSPGYKPVQITKDLASFWRVAYFDVRKDLRTRYPKHSWPEDPLTAKPEAKGRGRR